MTPEKRIAHLENIILREAANPAALQAEAAAIRANRPADCRNALKQNVAAAKSLLDASTKINHVEDYMPALLSAIEYLDDVLVNLDFTD